MSDNSSMMFSLLERPAIKLQFYRPKNPLKPGKLVGVKIAYYRRSEDDIRLYELDHDEPDLHYYWIPLEATSNRGQGRNHFALQFDEIYKKLRLSTSANSTQLPDNVFRFRDNFIPSNNEGISVIWTKDSLQLRHFKYPPYVPDDRTIEELLNTPLGQDWIITEIPNPIVFTESFHSLDHFSRGGSRSPIQNVPYLF